jgi:hypothetical protein
LQLHFGLAWTLNKKSIGFFVQQNMWYFKIKCNGVAPFKTSLGDRFLKQAARISTVKRVILLIKNLIRTVYKVAISPFSFHPQLCGLPPCWHWHHCRPSTFSSSPNPTILQLRHMDIRGEHIILVFSSSWFAYLASSISGMDPTSPKQRPPCMSWLVQLWCSAGWTERRFQNVMVQFGLDHRVPSVRDERKRRIADADYYCRIDGDEREMLPVKRRSSTWLAPADPRTDRALFVSPNPRFGGDPTWRRIGRGRWWGGEGA